MSHSEIQTIRVLFENHYPGIRHQANEARLNQRAGVFWGITLAIGIGCILLLWILANQ